VSVSVERIGIATLVSAAVAPPLAVALVSIGQRAAGASQTPVVTWLSALALVVVLSGAAVFGRGPLLNAARRLDPSWDGALRRRPRLAPAWTLLALVSVVQLGRLAVFMADASQRWASTYPPVDEGVTHMCMSAYVHAADLSRRVDNVYSELFYPAFGSGALGHTTSMDSPVANLSAWLEDPFEYPPPFLLLPRLGLLLTNDFLVLRTASFALKFVVLVIALYAVASALSLERRRLALLLMPALASSLPIMFDLQFGQFHLVTIVLAIGGMLAFRREHAALGGLLLGAAIACKIFPGILLVYLVVRREWRALAATIGGVLVLCVLSVVVLGAKPWHAFITYQLPRIASGEAFSFFLKSDLTVASNWSIYGIPIKLKRLGVPGMTLGVARLLAWLYMVPLVAMTVVAARRAQRLEIEPLVWLAALALASLRSPLAPNVYVGAPALWLLTLLASDIGGRARIIALFVVTFVAIGGLPPLPSAEGTILLWMTGQIAMLAVGFWTLNARRPAAATGLG
jgi:hypothetical protein